jgi:hypothetical protein
MKEKTTKGTTELDQGLNEGNPNTERTPIDPTRINTGMIGGTNQSDYKDEQQGTVHHKKMDEEKRQDQ